MCSKPKVKWVRITKDRKSGTELISLMNDQDLCDSWKYLNPKGREYSSFSILHITMSAQQSCISWSDVLVWFFIRNWEDTPKMKSWRLNIPSLYDQKRVQNIREEIKKYLRKERLTIF